MKRFPLLLAAAALLWMGGSRPAAAQAQVFSDRASWTAAADAVVTRDFEELPDFSPVETLSYQGVTFSSNASENSDALVAVSPDSVISPSLQSRVLAGNLLFGPVIATFSPAVRSVGLDAHSLFAGTSLIVTVETANGSQQVELSATDAGPVFVGFIADSGITRITVTNPEGQEDYVCVDNVSYGGAPIGGNPALAKLDALKASVEAGIANGSIKHIGRSLLAKVAVARAAVVRGKKRTACLVLKAFKLEVKVARKKIAPAKAAELQALADECIAALSL